ncbi:MAG: hypothetical protein HY081_08685 [Gammaproteobacteria bacterium]|nr:hypothetical protein [Gammaproteobacteria bacterium]
MPNILWGITVAFSVAGMIMLIAAFMALRRGRPLRMSWRLLWALMFFTLATAGGGVIWGVQGYRALTHEDVAVVVRTEPLGPNRFQAQFRFADGREVVYVLNGDQLYVDARILKWHAFANVLGLNTAYELDRVAGRYQDLTQEQQQPRTVQSLAPARDVDLFTLRQRYAVLSPLLDAEYGSATFAAADSPSQYEVRVSTTGLLIRKREP